MPLRHSSMARSYCFRFPEPQRNVLLRIDTERVQSLSALGLDESLVQSVHQYQETRVLMVREGGLPTAFRFFQTFPPTATSAPTIANTATARSRRRFQVA